MSTSPSPRVLRLVWGSIEAEGLLPAKDYKLFPGGGRAWDWTETGTRHQPGIQPEDVEELIARGARVVVLSRGVHMMLHTMPETLHQLSDHGIKVHVLETRAAVELYNKLVEEGQAVGGLFHSTC